MVYTKTKHALLGCALLGLAASSCVEHRPVRNGLFNESTYLQKQQLTQNNPKTPGVADDGWLYKVTIVKASSPNVVGDYAFPGFESDTRYVRLRFKETALQVVDARSLQQDDADDPNDDLATRTDLVLMEFEGKHVDIKLRENLDGERTNWKEENTERAWQDRQMFKVDFEKTSLDPVTAMAWFYGDFLHDCAAQVSSHLVPDSFELDEGDQSMNFVVETNYKLNASTLWGGCWDMMSLTHGTGTATIQYRFSFYRPGPSTYEPMVIDEKAPVNKKYGAFQVLNMYRDEETGILGAKSLLQRWNPFRPADDPMVFYYHEGFPERFKPMFDGIRDETNQILEDAGATLRVAFREHDWDGKVRHFGDLRYSFVAWHQDIDTTRGLLGYGPSSSDPRTGEVISANLNLYNVGMDYYRYLLQTYLEERGAEGKPNADEAWENISCAPGETVAFTQPDGSPNESYRFDTVLFDEMRRVMDIDETATYTRDDFVPTPVRNDAFFSDFHRLLPELRYVEPGWNDYVQRPTASSRLGNFLERRAIEREFQEEMFDIAWNRDPFAGDSLHTPRGIEKQLAFADRFRQWRRNHDELQAEEDLLFGMNNIYQFDAGDAMAVMGKSARRCKESGYWESDEEYSERIIYGVVAHVAIHEFGHNIGLRHNFYGSVDHQHIREDEVSSSVMDYVTPWEEAWANHGWGQYDAAAIGWIYGTQEKRRELMAEDFLFCTDQHRYRSPLCTAHDLGVTPSQIVLNAIERYDWLYHLRNSRAYRTFWDTSNYVNKVYGSLFPLQRMWHLGIFDWGGGGVQDTLKRLDQIDGARPVLSSQEYDEIAEDFFNDLEQAIGMTMAFYDSVINQAASFRNYQTEFDPYYGDILRLGIITDKLFATFAFMDLQEVYNYDPNVYTYVTMYDLPFTTRNTAIAQRVLDNMLGANYDTFKWFRYYAILLFGDVTNSNLVYDVGLKDRIAIRRFNTQEAFEEVYGAAALEQAQRIDNPSQTFVHEAEQYVYTYLADRNWHLVAGASRSPVSYQFMRDYNEDINAGADEDLDNYGLKILLAYYEYFNNFVGY